MAEDFGGYKIDFSLRPEETMERVFGDKPITSAQMTKMLWDYVKRNGLAAKSA